MSSETKQAWHKNALMRQGILKLIILYNVSSMNVLILAVSLLPYLEGAFLRTNILAWFAGISFTVALLLSIYHIYCVFSARKRSSDNKSEKVNFKEALKRANFFSRITLVLIIVYLAYSVYFLLVLGNPISLLIYSIISFGMGTLIAAFYLVTLILRRKRKSDRRIDAVTQPENRDIQERRLGD